MIRVDYHGNGPGGLYSFTPTSKKTEARMRSKCLDATWMDGRMYVEHRYALDLAVKFQERGEKLLHAETGKKLNTHTGGFTVDVDVDHDRSAT